MFAPTHVLTEQLRFLDAVEPAMQQMDAEAAAAEQPDPEPLRVPVHIFVTGRRAQQVATELMASLVWPPGLTLPPPLSQPAVQLPAEDPAKRKARFRNLPHRTAAADGEEPCAICLEKPKEGEKVVQLLCQHDMCSDCAWEWLKAHSTCPVCRFETL